MQQYPEHYSLFGSHSDGHYVVTLPLIGYLAIKKDISSITRENDRISNRAQKASRANLEIKSSH
jgi:hypothetical protein